MGGGLLGRGWVGLVGGLGGASGATRTVGAARALGGRPRRGPRGARRALVGAAPEGDGQGARPSQAGRDGVGQWGAAPTREYEPAGKGRSGLGRAGPLLGPRPRRGPGRPPGGPRLRRRHHPLSPLWRPGPAALHVEHIAGSGDCDRRQGETRRAGRATCCRPGAHYKSAGVRVLTVARQAMVNKWLPAPLVSRGCTQRDASGSKA